MITLPLENAGSLLLFLFSLAALPAHQELKIWVNFETRCFTV